MIKNAMGDSRTIVQNKHTYKQAYRDTYRHTHTYTHYTHKNTRKKKKKGACERGVAGCWRVRVRVFLVQKGKRNVCLS